LNTQEDMMPGGMPSLRGGGVAMRMLNFTTPFSSG
jgi:hypothetical protein